MKFPSFLARQKFRFDLGQGFLAIVNFAFVVLAASDKIATPIHLPAKITVSVLVPLAVMMVWSLGVVLDKIQFSQAYQEEQNRRNEMLSAVHSSINQSKTNAEEETAK
jgi:Mg2+/Co2+ transporter CorB